MEIKIGIQHIAREINLESNQTAEEVQALVAAASPRPWPESPAS